MSWISEYPMPVIILTNGVIGASFGMIPFYSAITSISKEYTWAAEVDGAGWLQRIRYVTLPLIRWPLMFVTAYQTLFPAYIVRVHLDHHRRRTILSDDSVVAVRLQRSIWWLLCILPLRVGYCPHASACADQYGCVDHLLARVPLP